ncbi:MAG: aspartyl protease family protein [Candidatus Obscuribacterales bacterium]|nr:aspartyl protease family protein [Candidatus Obscuribacterales bacterium]
MSRSLHSKYKIAILLSVFLIAGSSPLPVISAPTKTAVASTRTARDVAQQILAAYGGADAFKKMNDAPFKGKAQKSISAAMSGASNALDLVVYGSGDKYRVETKVLGENVVAGYDGQNSWSQFGDWISKDTATPTKEVHDEIEHSMKVILAVTLPTTKLELLPAKPIEGKLCDAIKITPLGQTPTTIYSDPQNHLVLRAEYMGIDREQGVMGLKAVDYLDYRPVSGSLLPFKTVEYLNGKKVSDTVMSEVDFNFAVTDDLFQMPRESEVSQVNVNPITIPFDFIGDYIIARVRLNNKTEEKFIVDTGASQTVLDKAVAQKLGPYAAGSYSITTGGKALDVNYMTLSSLSVGDVSIDNVTAMVYDISSLSLAPGSRIGGLLGANVLRRFLVTIDYRDKVLILANPRSVVIPKGATVLPITPVFSAAVPVVKATLDDKLSANFLLDTGAPFNNLPVGLAKSLLNAPVLPVAKASGLDGQKVSMGAVRFKTLKLDNLVVNDPVFAVSPQMAATSPSGLFTASALGILGNPIWRQFRTTLDYRNERLILEPNGGKQGAEQHMQRYKQIGNEYLKTKNYNLAIAQYTELAQASHESGDFPTEALALMQMGVCYSAAYVATHNVEYTTQATRQFQKAVDAARKSGDKQIEARVLAYWADLFIRSADSPQTLSSAQSLIAKASTLCPTESQPYAEMGLLLLKIGRTDMVGTVWDQALMLDPVNWTALWGKYELAKKSGDTASQQLIANQLKRYYPDVPDVLALQGKSPAKPAATTKPVNAKPGASKPTRKR